MYHGENICMGVVSARDAHVVCDSFVPILEAGRTTRVHPEDPGVGILVEYAIACFDRYLGFPTSMNELAFNLDHLPECTPLLPIPPALRLRHLCTSRVLRQEHLSSRSRDRGGMGCRLTVSVDLKTRRRLQKIKHLGQVSDTVRRSSLHCCMN